MTKTQFLKLKKVTPQIWESKRKKWVLLFLPLILSLSFQLFMSNRTVGRGGELSKIESRVEELRRENFSLREQIAKESSITRLEEEGERLGLVKPQSILYTGSTVVTASDPTFLGQNAPND